MISLEGGAVLALPLDQLALLVLKDLLATRADNEYNYLLGAQEAYRNHPGAAEAIAESLAWLRGRSLIARKPGQTTDAAIFVSRSGRKAATEGLAVMFATEKLQGLHQAIEHRARTQFLLGKFELGVFDSMKAVEVRVRKLGGFAAADTGVDLMNRAFGPGGPLRDPRAVKGEQDGMRALFAGSYGVLRNPAGHRQVDYDDLQEAAEAVHTASMLMRILDRTEQRKNAGWP